MARFPAITEVSGAAKKPEQFTNIVFDLGGVFASYSSKGLDLPVKDSQLKLILDSPIWHEYERGLLNRDECFSSISIVFDVEPRDLDETLRRLAATLEYNETLISFVRNLRRTHQGRVKVYLMTNISQFDWGILKPVVESWDIFDNTFPSFESKSRKPDSASYCSVLDRAAIDVQTSIFMDDKPENVMAGQVLGFHGIHFESTEDAVASLSILFGDPVQRGRDWMRTQAKAMWCYTNTGVQVQDQFAQLLILHLTGDRSLVRISNSMRTWNVFGFGPPVLTTARYPDDLDTTTMALLTLDIPAVVKNEVMDDMLVHVTQDGLFYASHHQLSPDTTYFDDTRPRLDPCVTANVLRLFYAEGRGAEVARSLKYMYQIISNRAYTTGTRYYFHPDWFFFYLSNLCAKNAISTELDELRNLLTVRLRERMGCASWSDTLSAAMRVIAAHNLGLDNPRDREILVRTQQADGSWSKDAWVYRYGSSGILFGSSGLVTAMVLKALEDAPEHFMKKCM